MAGGGPFVKEHAVLLGKDQSLVGILTENGDATTHEQDGPTGVLLLNAGLVHRIGPNRIYVKMARLLASMGFVVFRFDFSGIGDSGPRRDKLPIVESMTDEMRQALNYLEEFRGIKQFVCVGLCDGAGAATQILAVDQRVKKAVLINPPVPRSQEREGMALSSYYRKYAWSNPRSWLKFLSMRSSYHSVWKAVWMEIKQRLLPRSFQIRKASNATIALNELLRCLRTRGVQLLMVFSESDIGERYLREVVGGEFLRMKDCGLLTTERLSKTDHLVTPLESQDKLLRMMSTWLRTKG
jgi:pimeloyl-ACP methyl ester carboxylesterase